MRLRAQDHDFVVTQYRDASNLDARIHLHKRFSTNPQGWHRWVFEQLQLPPTSRILELGCGSGELWIENGPRVPGGWDITLSDFSVGMLREAARRLCWTDRRFHFVAVDAQAIPVASERFDAVIANHMLYHVPDRARALPEIRRILKPGGRLYASTVGQAHLRDVHDLVERFAGERVYGTSFAGIFSLENGREQLAQWFAHVNVHRFEDALVVTEAELLLAYVLSGSAKAVLVGEKLAALTGYLHEELKRHGAILITKDSGMFEAW